MKFGLKDKTIEKINSVFRTFPKIEEVIIYGSRGKVNFREGSDIDLTLVGDQLTRGILSKISIAIDALNIPYLFDLTIYQNLNNPELEKHIKKYEKKLYLSKPE